MRISDWSSDVCSSDLEGQSLAGRLVDAHVDLLAQVDDIRLRAPVATDKAHERGLQRQDFPQEPSFQGVPLGHRQSPLPTLGRMTPENPHAETASLGEFHSLNAPRDRAGMARMRRIAISNEHWSVLSAPLHG